MRAKTSKRGKVVCFAFWYFFALNGINSNNIDLQKMNITELNTINSNVKVLKWENSTAQIKKKERDTQQLVRTREAKMNNTKLNVYKTVLQ